MTGLILSSAELDPRRRRILFRCWHRGIREMDLILGPFADTHLAGLSEPDLLTYDRLLEENDQDLMAWILGQSAPPDWVVPLLGRITTFARERLSPRS